MRKTRAPQLGKSNYDSHSMKSKRLPLHISYYPYYMRELRIPRTSVHSKALISEKRPLEKQFLSDEEITCKPWVSKELENKRALQETQLVHTSPGLTTEGTVDLQKVADIRRAIRRRYANRTDMRKIFRSWDQERKGVLNSEDILTMLRKMNFGVNLEEAKMLVASASGKDTIDIQDFLDLVFDDCDTFNMNLTKVKSEGQLKEIASDYLELRKVEKLHRFLGIRYKGISKILHRHGEIIDVHGFSEIIKNLNAPPKICTQKVLNSLFEKASNGQDTLDCKVFIQNLKEKHHENNHPYENNGTENLQKSERAEGNDDNNSQKSLHSYDKRINNHKFLNRQKLPINQLDQIFNRARFVRKGLRECFGSEANLKSAIKHDTISSSDLEAIVNERVSFTKKDVKAFLSSFIYNQDGLTWTDDICKTVFMPDPQSYEELLNYKRAIPPHRPFHIDNKNREIRDVLQKLLDRTDQQTTSRFRLFKKFDVNSDGFLTIDDVKTTFKNYNLEGGKEFMAFLDPNEQGFINYQSFIRAIDPIIPPIDYTKPILRDVKNDLKVSHSDSSLKTTRFGSNPVFKNTFENFVPGRKSGLFASVGERMSKKNLEPINIGASDKTREFERQRKRIEYLQFTRSRVRELVSARN